MCDWSDQCNRNQEVHRREGPELSTEDLTHLTRRAQVSQEVGFSAEVGKGQYFVTLLSINISVGPALVCRQYTLPCSDPNSQLVCALKATVRIGPVLDSKTTRFGRTIYSVEVLKPSKQYGA